MDLKELKSLSIPELKEVQSHVATLLKDKALAEIEEVQARLNDLREMAGLRKAIVRKAREEASPVSRRGKRKGTEPANS